ncbi:MAG TPA: hypothetical protein VJT83_07045 [Chitinophagaceae bacterium]|nr:hypothetical protein [Chitinophagaceae bacterium]
MAKTKIIGTTARLAGILTILTTVPHVILGTAEVMQGIKLGDVRSSMVPVIKNIWVLSCIMLPLSGMWILFLVRDLKRLERRAWWQAILIGLSFAGAGIAAMVWSGIQIHLLLFVLIGLLLFIPMLLWAGSFSSKNTKNH